MKYQRMEQAIRELAFGQAHVQPERIESEAHAFDSELICVLHQNIKDGGMQMEVEVPINVIQSKARGFEFLELGLKFSSYLLTQAGAKKIAKGCASRFIWEFLFAVN